MHKLLKNGKRISGHIIQDVMGEKKPWILGYWSIIMILLLCPGKHRRDKQNNVSFFLLGKQHFIMLLLLNQLSKFDEFLTVIFNKSDFVALQN